MNSKSQDAETVVPTFLMTTPSSHHLLGASPYQPPGPLLLTRLLLIQASTVTSPSTQRTALLGNPPPTPTICVCGKGLKVTEGRLQAQIVHRDKEHLFCTNNQHAGVSHSKWHSQTKMQRPSYRELGELSR